MLSIQLGFTQSKLPEPLIVKVAKESFDATIQFFNINTLPKNFNKDSDGNAKIKGFRVTEDLNDIEISRIERFVKNNDDPKKKRMVVARYGIEEKRVIDLFVKAKNLDFKEAKLVVDLNRAVDINYDKWPIEEYLGKNPKTGKRDYKKLRPQKFFNDIEKAFEEGIITWKDNEMAKTIQKLMSEGYELNPQKSRFGLYSPGIYYDKETINPIMHLKETFLISEGVFDGVKQQIIRYSEATLNWSKKTRHNRLVSFKKTNFIPEISKTNMNRASYSFAHIQEAIKVYSEKLEYKKIKGRFKFPRVRFVYEDGSWQEPIYNQGGYNQNDRAVKILTEKINDIASFTMSHFVSTNTPMFEALFKVLKSNPIFRLKGVLDAKFYGWIQSFGIFHGLAGYSTIRPWGYLPAKYIDPDEVKSFRSQIDMMVYARLAPGKKHTFADEYPLVENLWHDKSHFFEYSNSKDADMFYGSMNASNNSNNTDLQTQVYVPNKKKSDFFQANKAIAKFTEDKRQKKFRSHFLTLEEAVFKNSFVYFTGLGYDEVSNKRVRKAYQALSEKRTKDFFKILEELRDAPRDHVIGLEKSSQELVDLRIQKLKNIFKLYKSFGRDYQIGMKHWIPYLMVAMSNPKLSINNIKQLMTLSIYNFKKGDLWDRPTVAMKHMKSLWAEIRPVLEAKIDYFDSMENLNDIKYKTKYSRESLVFFPRYDSIKDIRSKKHFTLCGSNLVTK